MRKITLIILALALCFARTIPAAAQDRKAVENALIDAVAMYDRADFEGALKLLKPLAAADPSNDAVFYYMALSSVMLNDIEGAETFFQEAVRLDPKNYWYRDWLARLYTATRRPELAIDIYDALIRDYPEYNEIYYALLNLYAQQGKPEKMLAVLDEIETVQGPSEMVAMTRFDVYRHMEKPQEAYKALEKYNEQFSSPQILTAMGEFNLNQYEDSLALACFQEALACDADCGQALMGVAETYRMRRSYPEFFDAMNQFVTNGNLDLAPKTQYLGAMLQHAEPQFLNNFRPQIDSLVATYLVQAQDDSLALQTAGLYYFNTDRKDRARSSFAKAAALYPESLNLRAMYVQVLSDAADWNAMIDECEKAFAQFPDESAFLEYKGIAYYNLKDYESVIANAGRIIGAAAGDTILTVQTLSTIGDMYHYLNADKKAYAVYDKALKLDPSYAPVLNNYAYFLCCEGKKLKKALAMSKVTIEQEPDNSTYLDTYAWILYLLGRPAEAKPYLKHAMLYGGKESVAVLDHYAEVLYSLKEYDLAKVYWNMAVNKNTDNDIPDLQEKIARKLSAVGK